MTDAMVTARMPQSKKDAGNEILRELGYSASRAINELYDSVIETRSWPLSQSEMETVEPSRLAEALSFVDSMARVDASEYASFGYDEAKRRRLIEKGRAAEADFE
ncbi:MAG TPA: RelB/DinJ family addiction module antitoxin [Eggerthellaceae bacterium]|nr:RelB/DinJ family addiction module antitoxin [Eggerthellaceae bacterium]